MSGCESVRGEWGDPCPDCGVTLPPRPNPLSSWQAQRATDQEAAERSRVNRHDEEKAA